MKLQKYREDSQEIAIREFFCWNENMRKNFARNY